MSRRQVLSRVFVTPKPVVARGTDDAAIQLYYASLDRARSRPTDTRFERLRLQAAIGTGEPPTPPASVVGNGGSVRRAVHAPTDGGGGGGGVGGGGLSGGGGRKLTGGVIPNQAASKARFRDTMTTLELEDKSRAATAEYRRSVFVSGNAAKALRTLEGQGLVGTEVAAAASERLVRAQAQQAISQTKMEAAAAAVDEQRAIAATKAGLRASRQRRASARQTVRGTVDPTLAHDIGSGRTTDQADTQAAAAEVAATPPPAYGHRKRRY